MGQQVESSDITPDSVRRTIEEFFNDPWQGADIPFVNKEDNSSIDRYLVFIGSKKLEFSVLLIAAGDDAKKNAAVRSALIEFSKNLLSLWEAEVNRNDDVLAEFIANMPEPEKDDGSSGISSGESVLPLGDPDPFRGLK